jgi:hypothetical protein
MSRRCIAERLLSLFTRPERAVSIVGDLTEEARSRSSAWYWVQLLGTASALCLKSVRSAAWRSLWLAVLGFVAYQCVYVLLFRASGLPEYAWIFGTRSLDDALNQASFGFWLRLLPVVVASNLLTGAVFGRWASRAEMNGIAPLVVLLVVFWIAWPFIAVFVYSLSSVWIIAVALAFPFFYLLPLVAAAALASRTRGAPATA